MRRIVLAVAFLFVTPVLGNAATITFSQNFFLTAEDVFPAIGGPGNRREFLSANESGWTVPAFNPALGTPDVLFLEFDGTATIKGELSSGGLDAIWDLYETVDGERVESVQLHLNCDDPCQFESRVPIAYSFYRGYSLGDPEFDWAIGYSPDKFAAFALAASLELETVLSVTARATYVYQPFAEPVPEPATLLLVGTGALALFTRARRNCVPHTPPQEIDNV